MHMNTWQLVLVVQSLNNANLGYESAAESEQKVITFLEDLVFFPITVK